MKYRPYLYLLLFAILAYLPVSSLLFAMKNDMINGYFKHVFHAAECIRHGYLPLWNPYQALGLPLHANPNAMVWSPVIWLVALLGGYNIFILNIQLIILIWISGIGTFKLVEYLQKQQFKTSNTSISLALATAYMLSGFMVSSAQFLAFITSLAWMPFVLLYYSRLMNNGTYKDALLLGFWLSMMILGGYPFFFLGVNGLLFCLFLYHSFSLKNDLSLLKKFVLNNVISYVAFTCFSAVFLISFLEVSPFLERANGLSLADAQNNHFSPNALISLFLPFSTAKGWGVFWGDPAMQNAYSGIFILLFTCTFLHLKKRTLDWLIIGLGIFCLLASFGAYTPIRAWLFHYVPFMDKVRHPALFRLFFMMSIWYMAGRVLFELQSKKDTTPLLFLLKRYTYLFLGFLGLGLIYCIYQQPTIFTIPNGGLKQVVQGLSVYQHGFIQSLLQISLLSAFLFVLYKKRLTLFAISLFIIFDMSISTLIHTPYTVVGSRSTMTYHNLLSTYPKDFPIPIKEDTFATKIPFLFNINTHKKAITYKGYDPFVLNNFRALENSPHKKVMHYSEYLFFSNDLQMYGSTLLPKEEKQNNRIYVDSSIIQQLPIADSTNFIQNKIKITHFTPNQFTASYDINKDQVLTLLQNNYKGWQVFIDGQPINIFPSNYMTLSIVAPKGQHEVLFRYRPQRVVFGFWVSLISFIGFGIWLLRLSFKKN